MKNPTKANEGNEVFALSIRQPWAWLIVNGYKFLENRSRRTHFRGPFLIHASASGGMSDYDACKIFIDGFCSIDLPPYEKLHRGGIVGAGVMTGCVVDHPSEWFTGPFGWVISNPGETSFMALPGQLGFFRVPKWAVPENFHTLFPPLTPVKKFIVKYSGHPVHFFGLIGCKKVSETCAEERATRFDSHFEAEQKAVRYGLQPYSIHEVPSIPNLDT